MKIILIIVICGFLSSFDYAQSKEDLDWPTTIIFEFKRGDVTFNHVQHSNVAECMECHHTGDKNSCSSCHGVQENIISSKSAFHKNCKNCHKEQKAGPTKCKDCHIK